ADAAAQGLGRDGDRHGAAGGCFPAGMHTPADGTPAQKGEFRRKRFNRAVDWAEDQQLIAVVEIGDVSYLWLIRPDPVRDERGD
ncbi:MAG: hypothetical protein WBW28_06465, partial [Pseudolabrys sp.]